MLTGLGASTWAGGSQPWMRKMGILTPKPISKPRKFRTWVSSGRAGAPRPMSAMAKLWPGTTSNGSSEISMKTDSPIV